MRRRLPSILFMLAYGLLEVAVIHHPVQPSRAGLAEVLLLVAIGLSVAALFLVGRREPAAPEPEPRWDIPLLIWLGVLYVGLGLQISYGPDIAGRQPHVQRVASLGFWIAMVAMLPCFAWILPESRLRERIGNLCTRNTIAFLLGLGCALKIMGIILEPRPAIDVWEVLQQGAENLAGGLNPFSTPIPSAAALGQRFGNPPVYYVYTPSTLLLTLPAVTLLGDVRYLYVISDLVAALLVLRIARCLSGSDRILRYAEIAALLIMFHPRSFAKAWTDTLGMPFLFWFTLCYLRRPGAFVTALAGGLFLSTKQYLVFLVPLITVQLPKRRPRLVLWVAAVATTIPFLMWNASDFYRSAIAFHFQTPFREDGMTLTSLARHAFGTPPRAWIGVAAASALTLAGTFLARNRGLVGMVAWASASYLVLFGFSTYAFPNYYHFVMGLLVLAAVLTLAEAHVGALRDTLALRPWAAHLPQLLPRRGRLPALGRPRARD